MPAARKLRILITILALMVFVSSSSRAMDIDQPWAGLAPDLDQALDRLCFDLLHTQYPVERVAVPDPKGPGKTPCEFTVYLVEEINRRLAGERVCVDAGGLGTERKCRKAAKEVLERRGLYDILREQSLEQSPVFDPAEVASMYRKVGVDGLVMLTVQDHGGELWLAAKLVDVHRGSLLSSARARVDKDREVKAMLARPLKADLTLTVSPPVQRGSVRLGPRSVKLGPQGAVLRGLPQGFHSLSLEAPCREGFNKEIYLSGDRTMAINLEPKPATLELVVKPAEALVTVDGSDGKVFINKAGMASLELAPGRHVITARAKGLPAKSLTVRLDCEPRTVTIDLTLPKYLLSLEVKPKKAALSLDGRRLTLDATGRWQGRVPAGEHTLRASAKGHLQQNLSLLVEKDLTRRIDLASKIHELYVKVRPGDAELRLDGKALALSPSGGVRVRAAEGKHVIAAEAKGCATTRVEVDLSGPRSLELALKPLPVDLEFAGIYQDPDDPGGALHSLGPGSVLKSGWYYAVAVKVSRRAHVYVYQLDSAGKVSRLFPRPSFPGLVNPVEPGKWVWSPPQGYRSKLDDHTGREVIFVLASARPDEKYSRLYAELERLKDDPAAQVKSNSLMAEALFRGEAAVVRVKPGRLRYGGKLFEAARRVIQASGAGKVFSLEFEHK